MVKVRQAPHGVVGIFNLRLGDAHGGAQKHKFLPQPDQIGALQHGAELRRGVLVHIVPVQSVPAAVKESLALFLAEGAAQNHVILSILFPHLGVSGVLGVTDGFVGQYRDDLLLGPHVVKGPAVVGDYHGLTGHKCVVGGNVDILLVLLEVVHGGVVQIQLSVPFQSTARKNAVLIVALGGVESYPQVLPMDQVAAYRVAPVHGAPAGGIGEVLIKKVVLTSIINKAVGIVDPVSRRFQMQGVFPHGCALSPFPVACRGNAESSITEILPQGQEALVVELNGFCYLTAPETTPPMICFWRIT